MKCQICKLRKSRHTHEYPNGDLISICARCRRSYFPTLAEIETDELAAERLGEYQAELGAGCYDLP